MIDASRVGKAIAHLRKRAGYTQQELAEQIGISDKAVSKWERGVGLPDIAYLGKLAALLDTDTDSLLAGDMIRRGREWQGLLILNSNPCGIGADTIIYDKPIACYLLGCFLLAGIDKIMISCPEKEETYLREILADGKMLGIELEYSGETFERDLKNNAVMTDCNKVMIMFGRHLVNGAGLTRYFERSMSGKERSVLLVNPVQGVPRDRGSWLNENQKIVFPDGKQSVASSNYRQIPILFTSRKKLYDVCCGIGAFSGEKTVRSPHPICRFFPGELGGCGGSGCLCPYRAACVRWKPFLLRRDRMASRDDRFENAPGTWQKKSGYRRWKVYHEFV